MSQCQTCRFWNVNGEGYRYYDFEVPDDEDYEKQTNHRRCLRILHGNKRSVKTALAEPAMTCDGSGYQANLWTLPEFGCSLYEAGEAPKAEENG